MEQGYIIIARKIRESQSYTRGVEYGGLMLELILRANHKQQYCYGMICERGQCIVSVIKLAEFLKLSRSKTNRMLKHLKKDDFLLLKADSRKTVITICNYDTYQNHKQYKRTTDEQQTDNERTTSGQQSDTNNECKELNNKKITDDLFIELWKNYPKRNGKKIGKAESKKLFAKFKNSEQKQIVDACKNYAASGQMPKDAERFLKKDYWKEWETPADNENNQKPTWVVH